MGGCKMASKTRDKNPDDSVRHILHVLGEYEAIHPMAEIEVYRQNSASIRIRIIDPDFQRFDRVDRDAQVWGILTKLPADIQSEISLLVLLTPEEKQTSFSSIEFDDPIPSRL
jgi:hypothetical protein